MIAINLNNIAKNFGFDPVLKDINLEILTGERVAIVGRNGSGKTTLFKLITGEESPDKGAVSIKKGAALGYLEQIPSLLPEETTVEKLLESAFSGVKTFEKRLHKLEASMAGSLSENELEQILKDYARLQEQFMEMGGYEVQDAIDHMVSIFRLKSLLNHPFNRLSGGQKTRAKLAVTLLKKPDILLLDEPTNHLDVQTLEWLEVFLARYTGTVVMISHDRYFLDRVATKTILLESGKCEVFKGNYSYALKERERLLLLEFEQYKNQQKQVEAMKAAIKRYRQWGNEKDSDVMFRKAKVLERRLEKFELLDNPQSGKRSLDLKFGGSRTGSDVLMVEDFSLLRGDKLLFDEAKAAVYAKEKVCLLGANGTGKSSFLAASLGQIQDFDGKIRISPSAKVGFIPQEIRFEAGDSVIDAFRREQNCTDGEARGILAKYYFYRDAVFKKADALSGGEKVLLKLAILMQREINFLILDEPTNHIDIETRELLEEALLDYQGTLLFISHDRYFINKIAGKTISIEDHKLVARLGNYDDFLKAGSQDE